MQLTAIIWRCFNTRKNLSRMGNKWAVQHQGINQQSVLVSTVSLHRWSSLSMDRVTKMHHTIRKSILLWTRGHLIKALLWHSRPRIQIIQWFNCLLKLEITLSLLTRSCKIVRVKQISSSKQLLRDRSALLQTKQLLLEVRDLRVILLASTERMPPKVLLCNKYKWMLQLK